MVSAVTVLFRTSTISFFWPRLQALGSLGLTLSLSGHVAVTGVGTAVFVVATTGVVTDET